MIFGIFQFSSVLLFIRESFSRLVALMAYRVTVASQWCWYTGAKVVR